MSFFVQFIAFDNFIQINDKTISFLYLFYYSDIDYLGILRTQGIFWEAGILQFYLNFYLYLKLNYLKESIDKNFLLIFTILTTFSTTGYFCLLLILIHSILSNIKNLSNAKILPSLLISSFLFIFSYLLILNFNTKFFGVMQSSANGRTFDLIAGYEVIKQYPFFGIGFDNLRYISFTASNENLLPFYFFTDDINLRGSSNGILSFISSSGLLFGAAMIFYLYNSLNNFPSKNLIFLIIIMFLFSQPLYLSPFIFAFLF